MNVSERITQALRSAGAAPAVEFRGHWLDWQTLAGLAGQIQKRLVAAGLGPGARVALVARNRPAHVAALVALLAARYRAVMVYAFQSPRELAWELNAMGVPAVIADSEDWSQEVIAACREAGCLGIRLPENASDSADTVCDLSAPALPRDGSVEVAIEMLTSGTTGAPKRVAVRFDTIDRAAADMIKVGDAPAAPEILPFPIGNISGLYYLLPAVLNAHPLVLLEKFNLDEWLDAVRRHRPGYCALPPAAVRMLLDRDVAAADLQSLAAIGVGAAPLAPEVQRQFEERYGIPVLVGYGATEFGGVVAAWTVEDHTAFIQAKRGSVGRVRPGVTLRVVDHDTGEPLAAGETGLLEAKVERIGPQWLRTTDLAAIDEDGFLFIRGRADDVINRGGFKVQPNKVEAALARHPAVQEAAVIGVADARLGEVPVAVIELKPGAVAPPEAELEALAREYLRPPEVPTGYRFVDALPRTPSMKVRRVEVRKLLADDEA